MACHGHGTDTTEGHGMTHHGHNNGVQHRHDGWTWHHMAQTRRWHMARTWPQTQMVSWKSMKRDDPVTYKTPGQPATVGQSIHHPFCQRCLSVPGGSPCCELCRARAVSMPCPCLCHAMLCLCCVLLCSAHSMSVLFCVGAVSVPCPAGRAVFLLE